MKTAIVFSQLKIGQQFKYSFYGDKIFTKTATRVTPTQTPGTDALGTKTTNAESVDGEVYIREYAMVEAV